MILWSQTVPALLYLISTFCARNTLDTHHQSKRGNSLQSKMVDLTEHVDGFYLIHRKDRRLDMVSTESIRFQHLPLQRDVP
ncbi:hypothetical protein C8Q70DRAFT_1014584 [Cubamyces menziesii]|nr:hypothetical protein C8Q70DRAFT_1014584 [Cubamyces menziesii]